MNYAKRPIAGPPRRPHDESPGAGKGGWRPRRVDASGCGWGLILKPRNVLSNSPVPEALRNDRVLGDSNLRAEGEESAPAILFGTDRFLSWGMHKYNLRNQLSLVIGGSD